MSDSGGANTSEKLVVLHDMLVVGCKHAPFVILLSDMIKKSIQKNKIKCSSKILDSYYLFLCKSS